MNKTPDETKRGLECCQNFQSCTEFGEPKCPYNDIKECVDTLLVDSLAYIRHLEAANIEVLNLCKQLEAKCHQLERERDALAADFKLYRERNIKGECGVYACDLCKHGGKHGGKYEEWGENKCPEGCSGISNWEWRGVKEE